MNCKTSGEPSAFRLGLPRVRSSPFRVKLRGNLSALRTGTLSCRWIVAPTRRGPPVDRLRATRSFVRSFLSAGLVCSASRPATDERRAAEAPFPARAACWGAVVIRGTASRSVRTKKGIGESPMARKVKSPIEEIKNPDRVLTETSIGASNVLGVAAAEQRQSVNNCSLVQVLFNAGPPAQQQQQQPEKPNG